MGKEMYQTCDPDSVLDLVVDGILEPVEPIMTFTVEQHYNGVGTVVHESGIVMGHTMLAPGRYAIVNAAIGGDE